MDEISKELLKSRKLLQETQGEKRAKEEEAAMVRHHVNVQGQGSSPGCQQSQILLLLLPAERGVPEGAGESTAGGHEVIRHHQRLQTGTSNVKNYIPLNIIFTRQTLLSKGKFYCISLVKETLQSQGTVCIYWAQCKITTSQLSDTVNIVCYKTR